MAKPGFIMLDPAGFHDKNFDKTSERLKKAGAWKKQRICVIIPAGSMIPAQAALSHWNLMFPPNQQVVRILAQDMEVGAAYSGAIENILGHPDLKDWEFILTVEHDNILPCDAVLKLIESLEAHPELSAVSGGYWTKGIGGVFQAWGDPNDPICNFRPLPPKPTGLLECCGLGMGCCLFRTKIFHDKRLKRPFFRTLASAESGLGTQDLSFWADARKYGYRCAVNCDVKVGHLDPKTGMVW